MQVGYRTEVGHVRQRNEDALLSRPERGVFAVADGLGGHPAGDVASLTAINSIDNAVLTGESAEGDLLAVAQAAHEAVVAAAGEEPGRTGMGTTLVLAVVDGSVTTVLHVGDSRAYLLDEGGLRAVTQDHGVNGYLSQALGLDRAVEPDVVEVECPPSSRLLLCTDGLTNMVDDPGIEALLGRGDAQQACDGLVEAALDNGGVDNVTVIVLDFSSSD